jgi:AraC-like DNA-binding protein
METLRINTFGREVVNGKWYISPKCNVNRIYFVNSGYALIQNGAHRYKLTEGKTYIIPKCNNFAPIEAKNFDHTFFDFYSEKILSPQKVIELNESMADFKSFFDFINSIVLTKKNKEHRNAVECLIRGFLSLWENSKDAAIEYIKNPLIIEAISLINDNVNEVTTATLSQKLNINKSYFVRLFTKTMGVAPMKYIRTCKVLYAKDLICSGLTVSEAAEKSGYSSPAALYKAMKNELNANPSMFK